MTAKVIPFVVSRPHYVLLDGQECIMGGIQNTITPTEADMPWLRKLKENFDENEKWIKPIREARWKREKREKYLSIILTVLAVVIVAYMVGNLLVAL